MGRFVVKKFVTLLLKVTKMWSMISQRIDYKGVGFWEASGPYPEKIYPRIPLPSLGCQSDQKLKQEIKLLQKD